MPKHVTMQIVPQDNFQRAFIRHHKLEALDIPLDCKDNANPKRKYILKH